MNDRHRTIERCKKKHRGKEVNLYSFLNDLGEKLVPVIEQAYQITLDTVSKAFDALKNFAEDIKTMPEEEYQKQMVELELELTPEQIAILKKIRGDGSDDRQNNPTESMGK